MNTLPRPRAPRRLGAAAPALALALALAPRPVEAERDLSGRWLLAQVTTTVATVPVLGDIEARTRVVALQDLRHDGRRLRGAGTLCRLDIDSGTRFVTTTLPLAFKLSLPRPVVDAVLEDGGATLRTGRQLVVVGARLERPEDEPLPTSPDDPRVVDQDRDGRPGVTIRIRGIVRGSIYVAQRSWTRLRGARRADGGYAGAVDFGTEQVVLGATSSRLDTPPPARPLPSASRFELVPVPAETTCAEALARTEGWFE
ncbi:MAG: hypothetical protein R3B09_20205 [Nannocystaceae bacterium]